MRRVVKCPSPILWLTWFLITGTATAQISVPAVVLDRSGQSIRGLAKSDFSVSCGNAAAFDSVEEVAPATLNSSIEPIPLFILYDTVSIPPPIQGNVSKVLLNFLRSSTNEGFAVSLIANTGEGVRPIHELSTDSKVLTAALDRVSPQPGRSQADASPATSTDAFVKSVNEETSRLNQLVQGMPAAQFKAYTPVAFQQLDGLQFVAKMLQRSRKRKLLVWITGSFPLTVDHGRLLYGNDLVSDRPEWKSMTAAYQNATNALNDSRVSVYPVQVTSATSASGEVTTTRIGLEELAKRTGGGVLDPFSRIEFLTAMAALRRQFDSYYVLSFSVQAASPLRPHGLAVLSR